ncbi:MAG: ABC-type transport auxiliary lipoprotein family protein [Acidiferrobacter sp.]
MPKSHFALLVALGTTGLVGCTLFPSRTPDLLVDHDFGPVHVHKTIRATEPVLLHIKSLSWLAGTRIHYRLLYRDPTAIYVYADNRWIAPPAALLKARIRARLSLGQTLSAHTPRHIDRLVLVLSRFDQSFVSPDRAFVRLAIVGRLYNVATGKLVASQTMNLRRACTPDARGAVTGLSALAREAATSFVQFVVKHERRAPKD